MGLMLQESRFPMELQTGSNSCGSVFAADARAPALGLSCRSALGGSAFVLLDNFWSLTRTVHAGLSTLNI